MKIEYLKLKDLKPYKNNPRVNTEAVEAVKNSIRDFGFRNPILIDKDNEIVAGHTRAKAAAKLKLLEVPCIRIEDLTEEQIKAFRIADNSSAELSTWDLKKLELELEDISFDMEDFGLRFDFNEGEPEGEAPDWKEATIDKVDNILNLERGQFEGDGYYDIPIIEGITEMPEVKEWIGFNYVMSDTDPEGKGVHFFLDDYQFERVWNDPIRYMEKLKNYTAVLSPDFSPYGDMPLATQLWNHYRKHWCAAYWQSNGITVIPTIRCSTDPRSLDWYLDGEPRDSIIAISSLGTARDEEGSDETYKDIVSKLRPVKILIYGDVFDFMDEDKDKIIKIQKFTEKRFGNGV